MGATSKREYLAPGLIFGTGLLAFAPALGWLAQTSQDETQLAHAVMILGLLGWVLWQETRDKLQFYGQLDQQAGLLMAGALAAYAVAFFTTNVVVLLGLVLFLAAIARYLWGRPGRRFTLAWLSGFSIILILALLMPALDWPLRAIAGQWSAQALTYLGPPGELYLGNRGGAPILLLDYKGWPFEVATECNGFGVLSSGLVLTLVLSVYQRLVWLDRILLAAVAILAGLGFNMARILIIVNLAPLVGRDNYLVMHEMVGISFFYGCLGFLWWLIRGFKTRPPQEGMPAASVPAASPASAPVAPKH